MFIFFQYIDIYSLLTENERKDFLFTEELQRRSFSGRKM